MAHFYGTLTGSRGQATRCGTKHSGITASVQSWDGSITVYLRQGKDGPVLEIRGRHDSDLSGVLLLEDRLEDILRFGIKVSRTED